MRPIEVGNDQAEQRLDRLLRKRFRDAPLSLIYKAVRRGWVRVNGRKIPPDGRVRPGDRIEFGEGMRDFERFIRDESAAQAEGFRRISLHVLYEDEDLIAVDKPPMIISQGISSAPEGSLLDQVRALLTGKIPARFHPELVHRLDRETSGVVLAAKTPRALAALNAVFRERRIEKSYLALVKGRPRPPEGVLSGVVVTWREGGPGGRKHRAFRSSGEPVPKSGETAEARSRYETMETLGDFSLIRVRPETGRTHQIRLQLQAIGHPVVGDKKYGDPSANGTAAQFLDLHRLFLHAERVVLTHPFTGRSLRIDAPMPPDLTGPLHSLRRHAKRA
ncbi:MAG: RluA family pseudouridine synthase [Planctomycetota bacterium]